MPLRMFEQRFTAIAVNSLLQKNKPRIREDTGFAGNKPTRA